MSSSFITCLPFGSIDDAMLLDELSGGAPESVNDDSLAGETEDGGVGVQKLNDMFTGCKPLLPIIGLPQCMYHNLNTVKGVLGELSVDNKLVNYAILHANCRSLQAHYNDVRDLVLQAPFNFDVLALTETWLRNDEVLNIHGYQPVLCNRVNKRGGGVAVYIHNSLTFHVMDEVKVDLHKVGCEALGVRMEPQAQRSRVIVCIYRPPNTPQTQEFLICMENIVERYRGWDVYICGDFNLDMQKYQNDSYVTDFYDLFTSSGFYPLIYKPTRLESCMCNLCFI